MKRNGRLLVLALALSFALVFSVLAIPIQLNDSSSTENTRAITKLLSRISDDRSLAETNKTFGSDRSMARKTFDLSANPIADKLKQTSLPGPVYRLSKAQWRKLTTPPDGPFITNVAFDFGHRSSPQYAFITSDSYKKYLQYLDALCRTSKDDDIAGTKLTTFDNDYFRWEEIQFSRALVKQVFPETVQGDHSRFLNASRTLQQMHLRAEPSSECKISTSEDTWSERTNERSQFEDFIINTIFRPHFDGSYAQRVLKEEAEVIDRLQRGENHSPDSGNVIEETRRVKHDPTGDRKRAKRQAKLKADLYRAKYKLC